MLLRYAITALSYVSLAAPLVAQDVRIPPPVMQPIETKAPAAKADRETLARGHRMLHDVWGELRKYYYDSTFRGLDTAATLRVADSTIDEAPNQAFVLAAVEQFLDNLHDSHTSLIPPGLTHSVDYGWGWQMIGDRCYVVSIKKGSDAEVQGLRVGDQVLSIDRVQPTRANIRMIGLAYFRLRPRPGMHVSVVHPDSTAAQLTIKSTMTPLPQLDLTDNSAIHRYLNEQEANAGVLHRWRTVGDSVLVWHMAEFVYEDEGIDEMMDRARHHKALILDLRGNGGGSIATLERLCGHFFAVPTLIATIHRRNGLDSIVARPQRGKAPFTGQVYVLMDSRSASSSEFTARTLQMHGATVIGDRSAGAVMESQVHGLSLTINMERSIGYGMSITVADPVMPDGNRLEGPGVIPNVGAVQTAFDIANHRDPALSFALEMAGVKMDPATAGKIFSEH